MEEYKKKEIGESPSLTPEELESIKKGEEKRGQLSKSILEKRRNNIPLNNEETALLEEQREEDRRDLDQLN